MMLEIGFTVSSARWRLRQPLWTWSHWQKLPQKLYRSRSPSLQSLVIGIVKSTKGKINWTAEVVWMALDGPAYLHSLWLDLLIVGCGLAWQWNAGYFFPQKGGPNGQGQQLWCVRNVRHCEVLSMRGGRVARGGTFLTKFSERTMGVSCRLFIQTTSIIRLKRILASCE